MIKKRHLLIASCCFMLLGCESTTNTKPIETDATVVTTEKTTEHPTQHFGEHLNGVIASEREVNQKIYPLGGKLIIDAFAYDVYDGGEKILVRNLAGEGEPIMALDMLSDYCIVEDQNEAGVKFSEVVEPTYFGLTEQDLEPWRVACYSVERSDNYELESSVSLGGPLVILPLAQHQWLRGINSLILLNDNHDVLLNRAVVMESYTGYQVFKEGDSEHYLVFQNKAGTAYMNYMEDLMEQFATSVENEAE